MSYHVAKELNGRKWVSVNPFYFRGNTQYCLNYVLYYVVLHTETESVQKNWITTLFYFMRTWHVKDEILPLPIIILGAEKELLATDHNLECLTADNLGGIHNRRRLIFTFFWKPSPNPLIKSFISKTYFSYLRACKPCFKLFFLDWDS